MKPTKTIDRRTFIKASLATGAAMSLSRRGWGQPVGSNSDIRVAVVGFNSRGKEHIRGYQALSGVRIVALCDVDQNVLSKQAAELGKKGSGPETFTDVRKLLESKEIDAISVATPNHWHALIAIWGCQAGKDVYLEKPVSHNVWEGRQIVNAARKYSRIVQTGSQSRSSSGIREAVEWVKAGNLGKLQIARGICYKPRPSIGKADGPQPIPAGVDYDLWCGPAPKEPLHRLHLHYDWHWVWPTGNGDLGNQGIHEMDVARWFLGEQELSPKVMTIGGRFGYRDDGETPNTLMTIHNYAAAPLIFEVRGLPKNKADQAPKRWSQSMDNYEGATIGIVIQCEGGRVVVPNYESATAYDKDGKVLKTFKGTESHFGNFISAVRSRKPDSLNAEIEQGHLSSALCHTSNISYRVGKDSSPEELAEAVKSNPAAGETFERMRQHLDANGVDLTKTPAILGAYLEMDPKSERFTNSEAANALLTRQYREPFVVPTEV